MFSRKISWGCFLGLSGVLSLSDTSATEPSWFSESSCSPLVKRAKQRFKWRLLTWTACLGFPILLGTLQHLEPVMSSGHWKLQPPRDLWKAPLVKEAAEIFRHFDFAVLPVPKRGPPRNPLDVSAKVLLIKVNQQLQYSSDLREFFCDPPQWIARVDFSPVYTTMTGALDLEKTVVSARHFRRTLQRIENQHRKRLLKPPVDQRQDKNLLKGTAIADTTEILAGVKENNLKQRGDNRFDKTRNINGFPQCWRGAKPIPGEKDHNGTPQMRYFWGAQQAAFGEHSQSGTAVLYEDLCTAKPADSTLLCQPSSRSSNKGATV